MTDPKSNPDYLKIGEAARFLGVNPRTIYRRVWSGDLPAARIGGLYFIKKSDLEALLTHRQADIADDPAQDWAPLKCSVCFRLLPSESLIGDVCSEEDCQEIICTDCLSRGNHFCTRHTPTREQRLGEAIQRQQNGELGLVVKASAARMREVNFLNRLQGRLGSMNSILHPVTGEVITVNDWTKVLESGDERAEVMHLLGKVFLDGDTLAKTPLNAWLAGCPSVPRGAKGVPITIQIRVISRLPEMVQNGFDTRPLSADDLSPWLVRFSEEIRQEATMQMVVLASTTGWDTSARLLVQGQPGDKGNLPFAHQLMMVYLFDLEKGDLIFNPLDDRTRGYAEIFVPLLPSEELEEVKSAIEKEMVLYDSLTLNNAVQALSFPSPLIEQAFERLAATGRFTLVQVPNLGLTIIRK